ncbi:hypothetical protein [Rhizobium sp. GN54]|uniref:hypothetical protein n=1 Tax=Rhizobium sp. GN54 TaxID=2898150 RepID=UPI001E4E7BBB|nr:hypothetical protein [Rhizobium sp. GN54]MCD2184028.1 hypothetical protein [Rhizobium sp. GN54]
MVDEKQPPRRASLGVIGGDRKTGKTLEGAAEALSADAADAEAAKAAIAEQVAVLKEEVARLRESLGVIAESSGQYAVSRVNSVREDVRVAVAANPLGALFGAALVGYLFGLRRR